MRLARVLLVFAIFSGMTFSLGKADVPGSIPFPLRQPLSGPVPVCFAHSSVSKAFSSIQEILIRNGFRVKSVSARQGELLAVKSQERGIEGRYLVWLGRDLEDCNKLAVFVEYAKFEDQLSKGLIRVIVAEAEEDSRLRGFIEILNSKPFYCPQEWLESRPSRSPYP